MTYLDSLDRSIDRAQDTEYDHYYVRHPLFPSPCTCPVVQHRRVHVTQGDTGQVKQKLSAITIKKNLTNMTDHAKLPMKATNLSRSLAPHELTAVQTMTMKNLKKFFIHLTRLSPFPLEVNKPFSSIRTAGKSWRGTERSIANE